MMPKLQFWYDFGSPYSYLTAMRIEPMAEQAGVEIDWRPFLLGPVFKAAGWESSPFLAQTSKLQYMWRDVERIADGRGQSFRMPVVFPANGVYAARIALVGEPGGWIGAWTCRVFEAVFEDKLDIARPEVLAGLCGDIGQDGSTIGAVAREQAVKDQLREQTAAAQSLGLFGAPTFITPSGEMFWGDDRLEAALAWTIDS